MENQDLWQSATSAILVKLDSETYRASIYNAILGKTTCDIGATFGRFDTAEAWLNSHGISSYRYREMLD